MWQVLEPQSKISVKEKCFCYACAIFRQFWGFYQETSDSLYDKWRVQTERQSYKLSAIFKFRKKQMSDHVWN